MIGKRSERDPKSTLGLSHRVARVGLREMRDTSSPNVIGAGIRADMPRCPIARSTTWATTCGPTGPAAL